MRTWSVAAGVLVVLSVVASGQPAEARRSRRSARFRAMTFNIRYDFKNDGRNRWRHRVDAVVKTISGSGAAVVCLQEDKGRQIEDLQPLLPEFGFVGRGRNATGSGERCSILFNKETFGLRESGDFWLSDTPEVPGSNTWGDRYPRKATWALLEVKRSRSLLLVVNTHLPEGDDERLRLKGLEVIRDWIVAQIGSEEERGDSRRSLALLVAGDFNADAGDSRGFSLLTEESQLGLRDVWQVAKPDDRRPGTYGGFRGLHTTSRIDWLLVAGRVRVLQATKLDEKVDGRWPSDHYPVVADLVVG